MSRFGEIDSKRKVLCWKKKLIKNWNVNVVNIVNSKLVKTKANSKYCIGYLDRAIRPLVLIRLKINEHFKTFKCK